MTADSDPDVPLDLERLVFFSDAVVAIAITLLVIELAVPENLETDQQLRDALVALGPNFFSFFLSFAVIGLWWVGHHRLMRVLDHLHGTIVFLNFVLLGAIVFLPFASGVLGHHGDLPTAVILYAATNVVAALALVGMRLAAQRLDLLREGVDPEDYDRRTLFSAANAGIFAVSIPIALVSPRIAILTWYGVLGLSVVRGWVERRRRRRATDDG